MTFRYLTFDCYGTLIDWKNGIRASLEAEIGDIPLKGNALMVAYLASEKQEQKTYQKYREVLRKAALGLSATMGLEPDERSAERFAASVPSWPAFPDTVETLKEFGEKGYKRFILSNVDTDLLEGTIKNNHLEIDGFVTAEEVQSYKPAYGHWKRFLEETGAAKDEELHVAQSLYHDIIPCGSLGIKSAWVNRYDDKLQPPASPDYICDSLAHVSKILG